MDHTLRRRTFLGIYLTVMILASLFLLRQAFAPGEMVTPGQLMTLSANFSSCNFSRGPARACGPWKQLEKKGSRLTSEASSQGNAIAPQTSMQSSHTGDSLMGSRELIQCDY